MKPHLSSEPNLYLALKLDIHSGIVLNNTKAIRLWYLLRAIDIKGEGRVVDFNLKHGAEALKVSVAYLQKLLIQCLERKYFRSIVEHSTDRNLKTIYLSSLGEIVKNQKIQEIGSVAADCPVDNLVEITTTAIGIVAQSAQNHSRYQAVKAHQENSKANNRGLASCEEIMSYKDGTLASALSLGETGIYAYNNETNSLFVRGNFKNYGASLEHIAKLANVAVQTVFTHLCNYEKIRIFKADKTSCVAREIEKEERTGKIYSLKVNTLTMCNHVRSLGKVFISQPCVYNLQFELKRPKYLINKVKKYVKEFNQSNQPLQTPT